MGSVDYILSEMGNHFNMSSSSASSVLSGILSLIERQNGGLSSFLDRFRNAGMGSYVTSWLGGDTKPITGDAVTNALGRDAVNTIASKAGLTSAVAGSAIGFLIPKLVQLLAPGGTLLPSVPPELTSYMANPPSMVASSTREAIYGAESTVRRGNLNRYLWPALALLVASLFGIQLWRSRNAFDPQEQVRLGTERAESALAALKPGYSAQDLVTALNLDVINFASGSAQIPSENYDVLNKSAVAIKNASPGTLIEIGGHTDGTGDPSSNEQLSEQRANNIRAYLMQQGVDPSAMTARGYGDTKPVATNQTEEGKFLNRRIEFTAMRE